MKRTLLALLLSMSSLPALAQTGQYSGALLLGLADQELESSGDRTTSGDDFAIGVRGTYILNDSISFEGAYQNYGEAEDTFTDESGQDITDTISTVALNLGVKGSVPLGDAFSVHGRVGLSIWDAEFTQTQSFSPSLQSKVEDDGVDFYYGIGAQLDVNKLFFVGVEYTIVETSVSAFEVDADNQIQNVSAFFGFRL